MKKTLFLDPISHTGLAYYSYSFAETMSRKGVDITYGYSNGWILQNKPRTFKAKKIFIGTEGNVPRIIKGISFVISQIRLIIHILLHKYRVVHYQHFEIPLVDCFFICIVKILGKKIFLTVHDIEGYGDTYKVSSFLKTIISKADIIFAHNQVTIDRLVELGCDRSQMVHMPHGGYEYFSAPKLTKSEHQKIIGLSGEKKYLLLFGTLTKRKGISVLVEAIHILVNKENISNIRLIIAGRPHSSFSMEKLYELVSKKSLNNVIAFHTEFIPDDMIIHYYRGCDIIIIPYLRILESGVLRQAFTLGASVIASKLEAFSEIITDTENALLFKIGDSEDLANKIKRLYHDEELRKKISKNAELTMSSKFRWEYVTKAVIEYYE